MGTLQIKQEQLPSRCEICHQADCFDPLTNICSRCNKVSPSRRLRPEDTDILRSELAEVAAHISEAERLQQKRHTENSFDLEKSFNQIYTQVSVKAIDLWKYLLILVVILILFGSLCLMVEMFRKI